MTGTAPSAETVARLVFARLDLRDPDGRPAATDAAVALVRDHGVGGFVLFGGDVASVRAATAAIREAAATAGRAAPIVTSDLERGAGQQVDGASLLPPLRALGAAGSPELARRAGEATAREARALGIDVVLAPVLDLVHPAIANPIVGLRSLGSDPAEVARLGAAFIEGVQSAGALACAKHFPGHGATSVDSHIGLPRDERARETLDAADIIPFRAAVEAGVASVMTAHVAFPDLGDEGPATFAPTIVSGLLRGELQFDGLVMTDALDMGGALDGAGGDATEAAKRALAAGADVLLHPPDPAALIAALTAASARDEGLAGAIERADARIARAREAIAPRPETETATEAEAAATALEEATLIAHTELADEIATAAVKAPPAWEPVRKATLVILDDDDRPGGDAGLELLHEARRRGAELRLFELAAADEPPRHAEIIEAAREATGAEGTLIVIASCDVRGYKGRSGLAEPLAKTARTLLASSKGPSALVALGDPIVAELAEDAPTIRAWGLDPACQRAAARTLFASG